MPITIGKSLHRVQVLSSIVAYCSPLQFLIGIWVEEVGGKSTQITRISHLWIIFPCLFIGTIGPSFAMLFHVIIWYRWVSARKRSSIANALELPLSRNNPSICVLWLYFLYFLKAYFIVDSRNICFAEPIITYFHVPEMQHWLFLTGDALVIFAFKESDQTKSISHVTGLTCHS